MPVERIQPPPDTEPDARVVVAADDDPPETQLRGLGPLTLAPGGVGGTGRVQVLRNTIATITQTFYVDGVPTDPLPPTATLSVVAADGTIIVAPGTEVTRIAAGTFSYTLAADTTAELDLLTAQWTSALGTLSATIEVVGGFVFSIAQARAAGLDEATYTTDQVKQIRTYAETELEGALGYALVPRFAVHTFRAGSHRRSLASLGPYLRSLRFMTVDDAPISLIGGLDALTWPSYGAVRVGYEHGLDEVPPGAAIAALDLALAIVGESTSSEIPGVAAGAERLITDDGTLVFGGAAVPTGGVSVFSVPSVNRWVTANRIPYVG
jgi:hypothetical protein